jgi:hypothetical protein
MAGAGIRSFAKTTGMTSWQTALKWTEECQPPLAHILRNSLVKFDRGMPQIERFRSKFSAECHKLRGHLKGIVSRKFAMLLLVPLES